ncbi:MAG TPA: FUSC family protein [Micromonosporaceae bacterium]|nr:FUSC family protein [Micromonosporaceae bacterium]
MPAWLTAVRDRAARDVRSYSARKALRAAVVVPVAFALGSQVFGDPQLATFAAFGSFALMLFVDFGGSRESRLAAYLLLAVTGAILVVVGTYLAKPDWLAVAGMAFVGFLVLFAGAVSSTIAAAGRAAILTYILPVMLPGGPSDIPARLAGWGIAVALAVPVALFVWPPEDQNQLRVRAAEMCRALARMLELQQTPEGGDPRVAVARAVTGLREAFRASAARPVALSTGSRLLVRLVDELEWLTTAVMNACEDAPEVWPEQGRRLRTAAAGTLLATAAVLDHGGDGPTRAHCVYLETCILALDDARRGVSDEALAELRDATRVGNPAGIGTLVADSGEVAGGEFDRPLYAAHELGYVVALTARTVTVIAAADSRSWIRRLFGRRPGVELGDGTGPEVGEAAAAQRIAVGHFDVHSVWLQNSIRGGIGLAAAVLVARLSGQQEGFWIVLGALSVLRSNALTTSSTALRAVGGTAVGFAVGGLLVGMMGTSPALLWPLLPVCVFISGYAPERISFVAGQAAFTVTVIILFNIIAPAGWKIGLLRVEDVALGCAASLAAGALFWPRGAGAALGTVLGESYRAGAANLRQAVEYLTGVRSNPPDTQAEAAASTTRVDDAFRQYLAERGAKNVPLESLTALANGATRLRLTGLAVTRLAMAGPAVADLDGPVSVLRKRTDDVADWYRTLGDSLSRTGVDLPEVTPVPAGDSFLDAVVPAVDRCGDPDRAEQAERLLWSGQYIGDINRLRAELLTPTDQVHRTLLRPWWRR